VSLPAGGVTLEAEVLVQVPFYDLDPMNIVWHGNYARYFEVARCALLEKLDYSYAQMEQSGYAWPVIDLHVRYIKPLRFDQKVKVKVSLVEWEHRLKLRYLISDAATGERLTKGDSVQVAVDVKTGEMCLMSPPVLFERLGLPRP
jgi:acyl-CoA thioester hydrolase